jgi:hypothetical protein
MSQILRDKIISGVLWIIIWIFWVYTYQYFSNTLSLSSSSSQKRNFDISNMSDTQLTRMAERAGITKEELKQKIDAGEDIRSIMRKNWSSSWVISSGANENFGR